MTSFLGRLFVITSLEVRESFNDSVSPANRNPVNGNVTLDFLKMFNSDHNYKNKNKNKNPRTHAILSNRICVAQLSNGQVVSIRNILLAFLKCPLKHNEVQPSWCTTTQREGHWSLSRGRFLNCLSWLRDHRHIPRPKFFGVVRGHSGNELSRINEKQSWQPKLW